jgi:hypothetical protein
MNKLPAFKQNITKFVLDFFIFIGFLLLLDPRTTGIAIHEWLGFAAAGTIVVHLLVNWNWIRGLTTGFFRKMALKSRLNYILNWLLFIDFTLVMLTGIMISEVALPALGIRLGENFAWRQLHSLTADWSLFLMAAHLALNWEWVVSTSKRFILRPIFGRRARKTNTAGAQEMQS